VSDEPDLESLRLLVQVAELGSVGKAARAVGIAQPSATKRLAALERRARLPLLVRTPQGSVLTEALLPRWLSLLRAQESSVHVGLTVTNSAEVARLVMKATDTDLGFVEGPGVLDGLASRVVGTDELIVVVTPAHPWARRRRVLTAPELAATPLVVREEGSGTRETLDRVLARHDPVTPQLALGSNAAVKGAAVAGIAPAVLSRHAVEAELTAGTLVPITVADLRLDRRLRAVWPKGRRLTGPAAALLQVI
jgi:DNA-binding transcriptional LysR family regulator